VKSGRFREDLYYRLNVIPVNLPPLAERGNDIPLLARFFVENFAREQGKQIDQICPEAMRKLLAYTWPGNVRELENSIEHAVVLAKQSQIAVADLPLRVVEPFESESGPSHSTIIDNEAQLVRDVLTQCNWNKTAAASRLGISRSTLYEKLKRFQIQKPARH
jgi:two-component system response regulator HydG